MCGEMQIGLATRQETKSDMPWFLMLWCHRSERHASSMVGDMNAQRYIALLRNDIQALCIEYQSEMVESPYRREVQTGI